MGICASAQSASTSEIERAMADSGKVEAEKIKLLLLGAGQSGKSTLFKQMKVLYGDGFSSSERAEMRKVIASNTMKAAQTLVEQAPVLGFDIENQDAADEVAAAAADPDSIDASLAASLAAVWADEGIQRTFASRSEFQLEDCASYFLSSVERQAEPGFVPTVDDVLRARVRTTGIVSESYTIFGTPIEMYDVGGQRNERKKWIHAFDGVNALIFVAAISEYDQVLLEDESRNRVDEALELFQDIADSKFFKKKSIMLFLNKADLFEQKLRDGVPIRYVPDGDEAEAAADPDDVAIDGRRASRFPGFDGETLEDLDPEADADEYAARLETAKDFFRQEFLARVPDRTAEGSTNPVYVRFSTATDKENVRFLFESCKDIILGENLRNSGFIDDGEDDDL